MVNHNILEWIIKKNNISLFERRTVKGLLWGKSSPPLQPGLFGSVSTDAPKQASESVRR